MALSRTMRQATVGLLALAALGALGWLWLWLRDFRAGGRSYRAIVEFSNAGGMQRGTSVAYRGVRVGRVIGVLPKPSGVDIEVEISPGNLLIPRNSRIEANQSGLIGETAIDITPLQDLPEVATLAMPLDADCNPDLIICNGTRITGEAQLDVNQLIRSLLRIANILGSPEFASNLNAVSRNASVAFAEIGELGEELQTALEEKPLEEPLAAISTAAVGINSLLAEVETPLAESLKSLDAATTRITEAIDSETNTLSATLDSIRRTSDRLEGAIGALTPAIAKANDTEIIENLNALSEDAAAAAENLRTASERLNDPETILLLQKTLDSARVTFDNVLKITSDVDELTGDPEFRTNVRQLIEALEDLLSSTQQLEQQVAQAQLSALTEESPTVAPPSEAPVPKP